MRWRRACWYSFARILCLGVKLHYILIGRKKKVYAWMHGGIHKVTKILIMIITIIIISRRRNYKYVESANWSIGRGTGTTTFESATLWIYGKAEFPERLLHWVYKDGAFHTFATRSRSVFVSRLVFAVLYHRLTFLLFVPQLANSRISTLWYFNNF